VIALTESPALRCAITEQRALSLLRSAITKSLAPRAEITEPFTLFLLTVAEQSFSVSDLRACLLSLPNDAVIALTESPALRCAITEQREMSLLRSAISESLALHAVITKPLTLFLLTVAKQSFAVSELRARGENRRVAITGRTYVMTHAMRSSSQTRPVINFH